MILETAFDSDEPKMILEAERKIKLRGARAMVADKMMASLQNAAQLTHHASCDATALIARKKDLSEDGIKCSIEDLLMLTVVAVLQRHPDINGTLVDREILLSERINLSIAMALPGNLLVAPAVFDAQEMDLAQLRAARRDLAERARNNKLGVKEMTQGTFTISNLGLTRVEHFTPILNSPQLGLLGIGRMTERAVRDNDQVIWKDYLGLSLTFDHRAIDGAPAAAFLTDVCESIERLAL